MLITAHTSPRHSRGGRADDYAPLQLRRQASKGPEARRWPRPPLSLTATSLSEPWLLGAQSLKGGHPYVVPSAMVGASTWAHRLTAAPRCPRMGTSHRWGNKGPERCRHLPKITELLRGGAWTSANGPSLTLTWASSHTRCPHPSWVSGPRDGPCPVPRWGVTPWHRTGAGQTQAAGTDSMDVPAICSQQACPSK